MKTLRRARTAGILSIITGAIGGLGGLALALAASLLIDWYGLEFVYGATVVAIPAIMLGLVAILGGIYALKRRRWGLALAGSICGILLVFFLGIPATIFVAIAKQEFETGKLWKPSAAGMLSLAAGSAGIIGGFVFATAIGTLANEYGWRHDVISTVVLFVIILGLVAILGGIYALKRRRWGLALAGSICGILLVFFLGIPATIFVVTGKNEFEIKSLDSVLI